MHTQARHTQALVVFILISIVAVFGHHLAALAPTQFFAESNILHHDAPVHEDGSPHNKSGADAHSASRTIQKQQVQVIEQLKIAAATITQTTHRGVFPQVIVQRFAGIEPPRDLPHDLKTVFLI